VTGDDDALDLELAAAQLSADATDVAILLRSLVDRLEDALGDRMVVQRRGGGLRRRSKPQIEGMEVTLGQDIFTARLRGGALDPAIARVSGGIRIKTESVPLEEWLRRLLQALSVEASRNSLTRQALENIVIGGTS